MEEEISQEGSMKAQNEIFAIVSSFVLLGFLIVFMGFPLWFGKTIILQTVPVDPFDPFRGQYLSIRYNISTIPEIEGAKPGDDIYLVLTPDKERVHQYARHSTDKPQVQGQDVVIKGEIEFSEFGRTTITYGIEQFFFERGAQFQLTNLTVEAKVDSWGRAKVVQLLHNKMPIEYKFREPTIFS